MAPLKSGSTTKSRPTSTSLKQGTLGFISAKRTASTGGIGKGKKPIRTQSTPVTRRNAIIDIESSSEEDNVDDIELPSSEEEVVPKQEQNQKQGRKEEGRVPPAKTSNKQKSVEKKTSDKVEVFRSRDGVENSNAALDVAGKTKGGVERADLQEKDPRWRKHHATVREKMGKLQPIHAEGQNKIHEILRIFDLSYEYGPCVGVTRLERWERASALGLNPPSEVREILSTNQGIEQTEFSQSVFYEEV